MFNPNIHHRRSMRLKGYDYAQGGAYFVTICTHEKRAVFGRVVDEQVELHCYGRIVDDCWQQISEHYPNAAIDEWIIMPNPAWHPDFDSHCRNDDSIKFQESAKRFAFNDFKSVQRRGHARNQLFTR